MFAMYTLLSIELPFYFITGFKKFIWLIIINLSEAFRKFRLNGEFKCNKINNNNFVTVKIIRVIINKNRNITERERSISEGNIIYKPKSVIIIIIINLYEYNFWFKKIAIKLRSYASEQI